MKFLINLILGIFIFFPITIAAKTLFIAASIEDVVNEMVSKVYLNNNSNITPSQLEYNVAGSDILGLQIKSTNKTGLFFSASPTHLDQLQRLGKISHRKKLCRNSLVYVIPLKNVDKNLINLSLESAIKSSLIKKIALVSPSVPLGQYSEKFLKQKKLFQSIESKRVYSTNALSILQLIRRHIVDGGIIYYSDAMKFKNEIKIVEKLEISKEDFIEYEVGMIGPKNKNKFFLPLWNYLDTVEFNNLLKKYWLEPLNDRSN